MNSKAIITKILALIILVIPGIYFLFLNTELKQQLTPYVEPILVILFLLVVMFGWSIVTGSLKSFKQVTNLELEFRNHLAGLFFGGIIGSAYISLLLVLFEVLTTQEKTYFGIFLLGCTIFLLIYPVIELYVLVKPGRSAVISGQKTLEGLIEFVSALLGNRPWLAILLIYGLFFIVPFGTLVIFQGLITALILWAMFLPMIYLGILVGVNTAEDILNWRLVRPYRLKDYWDLGIGKINFKKEERWLKLIPKIKIEVGGLLILLFATQLVLLTTFEIFTEFQVILFSIPVVESVGFLLIVQTLVNKGRGALQETWEVWRRQSLKIRASAVFFPTFIGVALFTNLTLGIIVNSSQFLQGFMSETGLSNHLTSLRVVLILEDLLILGIIGWCYWFPTEVMRENLLNRAIKSAKKDKWNPILQLASIQNRIFWLKSTYKAPFPYSLLPNWIGGHLEVHNLAIEELRNLFWNHVSQLSPPTLVAIKTAYEMETDDWDLRSSAIGALGNTNDHLTAEIFELILKGFKDERWDVQESAISSFGKKLELSPRNLTSTMIDSLLQFMQDTDSSLDTRINVAKKLIEYTPDMVNFSIVEIIIEGMKSPYRETAINTLIKLIKSKSELITQDIAELAIETLQDIIRPYDTFHIQALELWDEILKNKPEYVTPEMVETLFTDIEDTRPHIRKGALKAWTNVLALTPDKIPANQFESIEAGLKNADINVQTSAITKLASLFEYSPERTSSLHIKLLTQVMDDQRNEFLLTRRSAIKTISRLIEHTPDHVSADLVKRITNAIQDQDQEICLWAIVACHKLLDHTPDLITASTVEKLIEGINNEVEIQNLVIEFWEKILTNQKVPITKTMLVSFQSAKSTGNSYTRGLVVYAFGIIPQFIPDHPHLTMIVEEIFASLADREYEVRDYALKGWRNVLKFTPQIVTLEQINDLKELLKSQENTKDVGIAETVVNALGEIAERAREHVSTELIDFIILHMLKPRYIVQRRSLNVWGKFLQYSSDKITSRMIGQLIQATHDSHPWIQETAITACGKVFEHAIHLVSTEMIVSVIDVLKDETADPSYPSFTAAVLSLGKALQSPELVKKFFAIDLSAISNLLRIFPSITAEEQIDVVEALEKVINTLPNDVPTVKLIHKAVPSLLVNCQLDELKRRIESLKLSQNTG